jgi:hypothetical protein
VAGKIRGNAVKPTAHSIWEIAHSWIKIWVQTPEYATVWVADHAREILKYGKIVQFLA